MRGRRTGATFTAVVEADRVVEADSVVEAGTVVVVNEERVSEDVTRLLTN